MKPIDRFFGEHRFLSSFWPVVVRYGDLEYPSVEHAYQASKSLDFEVRDYIRQIRSPGGAKKVGQGLHLRPDWDEVRLEIMEQLIRQKFKNSDLVQRLLATGEAELIEGNKWGDTFWGVCRGQGHNHLGKLLMKVRQELRRDLG